MKSTASLTFKAFDLLAAQPVSSANMPAAAKNSIVVSAVADGRGREMPISLFGDAVWDLSALCERANGRPSNSVIRWPEELPAELVTDCKSALYAWFKRGLPGYQPPIAMNLRQVAVCSAIPIMRWMAAKGLRRFDELSPLRVASYVEEARAKKRKGNTSTYSELRMLDLLWTFRGETASPLPSRPWGADSTLGDVSGLTLSGGYANQGKTLVIPPTDQAKIFNYCEAVLANAGRVMDRFDQGRIALGSDELVRIRDCALYVISITTGMRNDEAIGIESGACRTEIIKGVEHHWIATVEHKTGKGHVEYLAPKLTLNALAIMERYAKPFHAQLATEIDTLSKLDGERRAEDSTRLAKARRDRRKLFLMQGSIRARDTKQWATLTQALSMTASEIGFRRLAELAGSQWRLLPHQTRKTYARCFVESRMGRSSLVFLKWQFKHTSMSMTELYASNPRQDADIFDDILAEMVEFKIDLIESWLGDAPLSGGAGREVTKLRAIPIANRQALLAQTAGQVHVRATGHGWCLAEEKGCGGAGLYEATRCVGCKSGLIDKSFEGVWRGIQSQQLELLELSDVGPAVRQRAQRDLNWATQVMRDLGAELPSAAEGTGESSVDGGDR